MDFDPSETQFFRKQKRNRARITLPMEMLAFSLLLVNALSAGFGYGLIGRLMMEQGSADVWLGTAGPIALVGLLGSAYELFLGEKWQDEAVRRACFARQWLGLGAIVMWLFLASMIYEAAGAVIPALGAACVAVVAHGWAVLLCKRTYVILTPGYDTGKLEASLERKRLAA